LIKDSISKLEQVEQYLPQLKGFLTRLRSSYLEIKDISEEVAMLESETSIDEQRSQIIQDRLSLLFKLQQKHHVNTVTQLIEIKDDLNEKIEAVSLNDELIRELLKSKEKAEK